MIAELAELHFFRGFSIMPSPLMVAAAIAQRTGSAIAIGHPRPTTLAAVRAMIPRLQALGVQFVLVQDLVGKNGP